MNNRYLIKTIRGEEIVDAYPTEALAREAFDDLLIKYKSVGLYLIRFDPRVIEVTNPS